MLPTLADRVAKTTFSDRGQQRKHMLHDQRWSNGVQRKGTREIARIELAPTLLGSLAIIIQKTRRIDHKPKLALLGGERCGALQTRLVQQVDGRRGRATETNHMLEAAGGTQCFNQCAPDAAAGTKNDRNASLRKRTQVDAGRRPDRCGHRPGQPRFAPLARVPSFCIFPTSREIKGRPGRKTL
jgi:hypothetical protein